MSDAHEPLVKTPRQLITVIALAFVVPILVIVLLANFVTIAPRQGAGSDSMSPEAVEARIRPVAGFELKDASGPAVLRTGEAVFKGQCSACHAIGAAGAPKFGDEAAWQPRIKTGYQALLLSALKGKNAMPPQSGGEYSDAEIARGVVYMANAAGAKFPEPAVPAP
jgi:cytochrome c5